MKNNLRRQFLIDKKFQFRVFYKFLLMITFSSVLTGGIIYFYSAKQEKINSASLYYVTDKIGEDPKIVKQTDLILPAIIASEIVIVLITAIFVLFYSHKIAGPVYRFKKVTEEVAKGNFDIEINLRKNDEFKDLAESFNSMIKELSEKERKNKNITNESRYKVT